MTNKYPFFAIKILETLFTNPKRVCAYFHLPKLIMNFHFRWVRIHIVHRYTHPPSGGLTYAHIGTLCRALKSEGTQRFESREKIHFFARYARVQLLVSEWSMPQGAVILNPPLRSTVHLYSVYIVYGRKRCIISIQNYLCILKSFLSLFYV